MPVSSSKPPDGKKKVRVRGRLKSYVQRCRIGRRDYYLLERVGSPFRQRYLAFDPRHGPQGEFFLVQRWHEAAPSDQQLSVLRRLNHDSFPRVWEQDRRGANLDVVLTWVEGVALDKYLGHIRARRRPAVDAGQALRLVHGLAAAVSKLHQRLQIAHGDIQPANIIVTSHTSRLVLIDFGSAWTAQSAAFREEGDGINRCYAAPELQGEGCVAGFAADQFSVSVILYELLTLELPYGGLGGKAGRAEFLSQAKDSLLPPSKASPACQELPRSLRDLLDRVALRGLALNPEERYPDRHSWLDDLFQASARFRLPPQLSPSQSALTRVIRRFVKRDRTRDP